MEEFANLCRKNDLGRIAIKDSIYNLEKLELLEGYHQMGGTRMGTDKKNSGLNINRMKAVQIQTQRQLLPMQLIKAFTNFFKLKHLVL